MYVSVEPGGHTACVFTVLHVLILQVTFVILNSVNMFDANKNTMIGLPYGCHIKRMTMMTTTMMMMMYVSHRPAVVLTSPNNLDLITRNM